MVCEITYLNENKTYSQGEVARETLRCRPDSISFTTARKHLIYFFENIDAADKCYTFLKECFAANWNIRLEVARPADWTTDWVVMNYGTFE